MRHIPFSLGSLMIMAMLSVRRKRSSYVAVRLSGITETCNVPLRCFPCVPEELVIPGRAAWKASSSFVLRGGTYGSGILNRNITEPASLKVLVFYAFILFLTLCETLFSQYLRWLKPCFMCTDIFPSLILPAIINRERAVPFCFWLKPWHKYQPSLYLSWISWCSLNSFRLRLSKSHTYVCCTCGMTSVLCAQCCDALPLKKVQIHSVNKSFP